MKLKAITHPVVGRLVPDEWEESLLCFREIPPLKQFVAGLSADALNHLDDNERKLVESWKEVPGKLVKHCRENQIFDGLRALGVFEVAFEKIRNGTPSEEQVAAYQNFQEHQVRICGNVAEALLRYYRVARTSEEEWFDDNDCPEAASVDELAALAALDSVSFTKHHCEGLSILLLSWQVDWDVEHGLSMAVWKDQVVGIGMEDIYDLSDLEQADFLVWNRSHMTESEREHLARVSESIGEPDDDDDEDDDW